MHPLWIELTAAAGIALSDEMDQQLRRYIDLLLAANETMNLTRITTVEAAEVGHVADSLTLLPFLPTTPHRLADVGSGGGVPGLPLAIVRPDVKVTLIESTQKKATFLEAAARNLGISNVKVSPLRAEEVATGSSREAFAVVVARAVGALNILVEWCLPLVAKGGKMLAMKGARVTEELPAALRAIHMLGGSTPVVHAVTLPGTEHHVVVEVSKSGKTDARYPRPPSVAKGKPLGS